MRKSFSIVLLLLTFSALCAAQDTSIAETANEYLDEVPGEESLIVAGDTTAVFRFVAARTDSVRDWRGRRSFSYMKNLDSLLKGYKPKDAEPGYIRSSSPRTSGGISGTFQVILWIGVALLVLFIIWQLFLNKGAFRNNTLKKTGAEEVEAADPDQLHGTDFNSRAAAAAKAGQYREGVRLLFLNALQQLDEKRRITYAADKTNYDYLRELPDHLKNGFSRLSLYYEYVWYGKSPITSQSFDTINASFTQFSTTVK